MVGTRFGRGFGGELVPHAASGRRIIRAGVVRSAKGGVGILRGACASFSSRLYLTLELIDERTPACSQRLGFLLLFLCWVETRVICFLRPYNGNYFTGPLMDRKLKARRLRPGFQADGQRARSLLEIFGRIFSCRSPRVVLLSSLEIPSPCFEFIERSIPYG